MLTHFAASELAGWISNFDKNPQAPFITTSALISLKELEDFIAAIKKQQADSVRVYFLRFRDGESPVPQVQVNGAVAKGCEWLKATGSLTQATVALVPARNFMHDENYVFSADDIREDNLVMTLLPGTSNEGTGLNPPGLSGFKE